MVVIVEVVVQCSERWDGAGCHRAGVVVIAITVIRVLGSGQRERVVMERSRTSHLHWHCQEDECGGGQESDGGECVCCGGRQHERGREVVHRSACPHTRCGRRQRERGER